MHKHFLLLAGMLLGSQWPTAAQTSAPQIVTAREQIAPTMTIVGTLPTPLLAAPFLLPENPGKSAAHFNYLFVGTYEGNPVPEGLEGLRRLSSMREVKTLFLTQSLLPLVQLWGGRLRLDGFTSKLHMQNVQLGPSAAGGLLDFRPSRQNYPGGPRSVGLYGISLSFHLGRDAQIGRPTQIWRSLARIVSAAR
jgi:hypothetical protein